MLGDLSESVSLLIGIMKDNTLLVLQCLVLLWGIHIINFLLGYRLNRFGLYPRKIFGLVGIFTSPLLHGDFNHLFFNSVPLFLLANFMMISGIKVFLILTAVIAIGSGILTWTFGRPGFHVGASGVILGYMGFLLANAFQYHSAINIVIALVCLFYFGSLLLGLVPRDVKTSSEGHIFGFILGIICSIYAPFIVTHFSF